MRVLQIQNDSAVAQSVELMLKSESFNVYTTDEGRDGVELARLYDYDAIVLSTTPDRSALDQVRAIRAAKVKAAILVLSADCAIKTCVKALGAGADDFMTLPFHRDEFVARLLATARRSKGHTESKITINDLVVNLDTKTVTVAALPVHLTAKEYAMLELLALRKNQTVTKEMFFNYLYGGMDEPEIKIIDVFICKLRKKIGPRFETVRGRGYIIRDAETPKMAAPMVTNPVGRIMDGIDGLSQMVSA